MEREKSSFAYIAIGIIVIVVSLAVFALVNDSKEAVDWAGLLFVLISEVFFFGGIAMLNQKAKKKKIFLTAGVLSTLSIYLIATFIVSMVFCFWFREEIKILTAVQLIIIALTASVCILLKVFAGKADENN